MQLPANFTVDRLTWLNGQETPSMLLSNYTQRRCCLGFLGKAIGLPDESMQGVGYLAHICSVSEESQLRALSVIINTNDAIAEINDGIIAEKWESWRGLKFSFERTIGLLNDMAIPDRNKEAALIKVFKRFMNIELRFTN